MPLPWFKRQGEDLPDELKDMESKDLVEAIKKSREVDELRTKLTAAQEKANEVDEVRAQLAALEQRVPRQEEPRQQQPTGPTSVLDDEDKAFNERMGPWVLATLTNQAQSAKFQARQSLKGVDAAIWDKYSNEIDDVMKTVQLNFQAQPQTWINALDTISGRHRKDLLKMNEDKTDFFAESADRGGRGGPDHETEVHLTAEQENIAKRLGLKPEEYLKNMKEMTVRG